MKELKKLGTKTKYVSISQEDLRINEKNIFKESHPLTATLSRILIATINK